MVGDGWPWLRPLWLLAATAQQAPIWKKNPATFHICPAAKRWKLTNVLRCARSRAVAVTVSNQTDEGGRQLIWSVRLERADGGADLVQTAPRGQTGEGQSLTLPHQLIRS